MSLETTDQTRRAFLQRTGFLALGLFVASGASNLAHSQSARPTPAAVPVPIPIPIPIPIPQILYGVVSQAGPSFVDVQPSPGAPSARFLIRERPEVGIAPGDDIVVRFLEGSPPIVELLLINPITLDAAPLIRVGEGALEIGFGTRRFTVVPASDLVLDVPQAFGTVSSIRHIPDNVRVQVAGSLSRSEDRIVATFIKVLT